MRRRTFYMTDRAYNMAARLARKLGRPWTRASVLRDAADRGLKQIDSETRKQKGKR